MKTQAIENAVRADRAQAALAAYAKLYGDDDIETLLIDLLTDLRHLAPRSGASFARALRISRRHLEDEVVA